MSGDPDRRPSAEDIFLLVRADLDAWEKNASDPAAPGAFRGSSSSPNALPLPSAALPAGEGMVGWGSTGTASTGSTSGLSGSVHCSKSGTVAE